MLNSYEILKAVIDKSNPVTVSKLFGEIYNAVTIDSERNRPEVNTWEFSDSSGCVVELQLWLGRKPFIYVTSPSGDDKISLCEG